MPTIIDSLVVRLGLDPSGFRKEKEKVDKGLNDTGKTADSAARSVAKFLAVVGGAAAVKHFVSNMIDTNAELDRFSRNLGQNARDVSAWSKAAEVAGGTASGLQGTMDMLSRAQTELMLTGQSSLIPYLSALGISLADSRGKAKPLTDLLSELSGRFGSMDRTTAFNMGRMMGIDAGTMNLLLRGRQETEMMVKRQKEFNAVTKEQAEQSSRLRARLVENRQEFEALGRSLAVQALPYLEKFLDLLSGFGRWVSDNKGTVGIFFAIVAAGMAAIALAATPINVTVAALTALAGAIALVAQDYLTWKRGGESFIDWGKWEPGINAATKALKHLRNVLKDVSYALFAVSAMTFRVATGDFEGAARAFKDAMSYDAFDESGATKSRQQTAIDYFKSQGWTQAQAVGLAANIQRESGFNPSAVGDNGKAYGIAQWHPYRQAQFKTVMGKDIRASTFEEQLAFMQYELLHTQRVAGNKLRRTRTATDAASVVSQFYERPANAAGEAMARSNIAAAMAGIPGASSAARAASSRPPLAAAGDHSKTVETHIGEVKVYSQATDAQGIARDLGRSLDYLFASQANSGMM